MGLWLKLIVAVLATWRITHLLASEDGPADLIVRLRVRLGQGFIGRLMDCFQCLSLWVAAPVTLFLTRRPVEGFFIWLALSGGACLLERFGHEPVVIQPIQQAREGAEESGMLRSETSGFADELHGDN
jgi:hypothetical protein